MLYLKHPGVWGETHGDLPTPELAPQRDDPYAPDVIGLFVDHRPLRLKRFPPGFLLILDVFLILFVLGTFD